MLKKRITILGKSMPILAPIAITLVVVGIALAAILVTVTQTITQKITEVPVVDKGEITAPTISMPNVEVNNVVSRTIAQGVQTRSATAGVYLCMEATIDALYDALEVKLICKTTADEIAVPLNTELIVDMADLNECLLLGDAGIYVFDEVVTVSAGDTAGDPSTSVVVSLQTTDIGP